MDRRSLVSHLAEESKRETDSDRTTTNLTWIGPFSSHKESQMYKDVEDKMRGE